MGEGEEQEKEEGRGKECGDIGQGEMWEGKGEWQRGVGKERARILEGGWARILGNGMACGSRKRQGEKGSGRAKLSSAANTKVLGTLTSVEVSPSTGHSIHFLESFSSVTTLAPSG